MKRLYTPALKIKKGTFLSHFVSNVVILAVLAMLYFGTVEIPSVKAAYAPIYKGDGEKQVSLMINVYWGTEYIEDIMEVLDKYDAEVTFFVGGSWAEKNMELLKKMALEHEIGNHGYLHKDHKQLNKKQNKDEIMLCDRLVTEITGKKMTLFAPPSGSFGQAMLDVCAEVDYKVIMWSKDTIDWRDKDYQLVFKRATQKLESGDLILMHPTEHTLKALPLILEHYKSAGYKAVSVSENLSAEVN